MGEVVAGYASFAASAWTASAEHLNRALALDAGSEDAAYLLAKLYAEAGDSALAAGTPDRARQAFARSARVAEQFAGGDPRRLERHFLLAAAYANAELQLGLLALNGGQLDSAGAAFERSLASGVRYPEAHNNLGVSLERRGRLDEATAQYQRAMADHPRYAPARMNLGNIELRRGRMDAAIARYREVLRQQPDNSTAYYNLGAAYFQRRQWRVAADAWTRALDLKPDFEQARRSLELARDSLRVGAR
jgi:tetratricopeptide (TPR) repeat protein